MIIMTLISIWKWSKILWFCTRCWNKKCYLHGRNDVRKMIRNSRRSTPVLDMLQKIFNKVQLKVCLNMLEVCSAW